jgi:hypothetical protein
MNPTLRRGAIVVLLVLSAACSGPTSPTTTTQTPVIPVTPVTPVTPPPPQSFAPRSGPSRTFVYDHALADYVDDLTKHSRVVLYDDGAFVIASGTDSSGDFPAEYTVANGVITYVWDVPDTWRATGTLNGTSLTVRYNDRMIGAGFYDAAYVLACVNCEP